MYAPSPQIRRSRAVAARAAAVSEYQPAPPHVGGAGLAAATGRRRALVPLGARRARAGEHRPAPAARCYCRTTADPGRADAVVYLSEATEHRAAAPAYHRAWPAADAHRGRALAAAARAASEYRPAAAGIGASWPAARAGQWSAMAADTQASQYRPAALDRRACWAAARTRCGDRPPHVGARDADRVHAMGAARLSAPSR